MHPRRTLSLTARVASLLLLSACEGLLPDRRQPTFDAAASVDSAAASAESAPAEVERSKAKRRAEANARRVATAEPEVAAAFDQIRRSLRLLVAAEQGFYAENGTYTGELDRLAFRLSGESQVKFLWVTRQGWAASGTHPAVPGRDCVVFVGVANAAPTTLRFTRRGREGVVVCDVQPGLRLAEAGSVPAPAPVADTLNALDAVNPTVQMKVDLKNLAHAQAAYFATQGSYSPRSELLQLQFAGQRGVNVMLLNADRGSWSARATHVGRPGRSCVVWYGSPSLRPATEAQRRVPNTSGVPACDD
jgi:hypothetical protein